MVCKEDVVLWFKELSGHKRIDVMCSLLNKCLPAELRFFGTCLEDIGKQHFNQMKDFEAKANNPAELSELLVQCIISDARTRQKLALYICLIRSLNTTCSTTLYKTLSTLDINQIVPLSKNTDEKLLEELLLIYTIAVNHPAFTFEQKATLGNILLTLREKEKQFQASKLPEGLSEEYINSELGIITFDCTCCTPPATNANSPKMPPRNIPPGKTNMIVCECAVCAPPSNANSPKMSPRNIPPGKTNMIVWDCDCCPRPTNANSSEMPHRHIPPEKEKQFQASKLPEGLSEEYINSALNLISCDGAYCTPPTNANSPEMPPRNIPPGLNYPTALGSAGNYIPIPTYPPFPIQQHPPSLWQVVNVSSLPAEPSEDPEMESPVEGIVISPYRSPHSSPSQSTSPSRTTSPVRKSYHHRVERNNSQPRNKPNYIEYPHQNPVIMNLNISKKNCMERFEGKDVKPEDEMRGLTDRKTELGNEEIQQLRAAVVNGITDPEHRDFPHFIAKHKGFENEVSPSNVPILPRPLEANLISNQPPSIVPLNPCCLAGTGPRYTPQVYCHHNLQALNLDNDGSRHCSSSSSNSDASSTSHSPPPTPGNPNQNWEKGFAVTAGTEKPPRLHEPSEGCSEDPGAAPAAAAAVPKQERTRFFAGRGRGRLGNPVGIQTLPRGRGPHSNIVVDNSHKNLSNSRKEGPRSAPPTRHDDKKGYVVPSAEAPQSSSTMALPLPSSGKPPNHDMVASGVPYSTTFLPTHFTGPPMIHTYHGAFVRPSFHFHNGDLQMYPYQPQPPFVPPPVVTYSATIPPPKMACYNCSSQSHHASECKEPTMEEYTSKGQYRIDYKPYYKPGECLSEK